MAQAARVRDWAEVDFYASLGLTPDASDEEIARAFRTLAKQYHPDAGAAPSDAERFKDINAAYRVLGDPAIRRDYDRVRAEIHQTVAPPVIGPSPAFRAPRSRRRGWTRARAIWTVVGGAVCVLLGIATIIWIILLHGPIDRPPDTGRDITLGIVAAKFLIGGPICAVYGAMHLRRNGRSVRHG